MRPALHPDMGIVPIAARIACQLTYREYFHDPSRQLEAGQFARIALMHLPLGVDGIVRLALHSLGVYLDLGYSSSQWLAHVLEAAHYGHSFRRCFFFDYKANRGLYPRVTNRGVQTSPSHYQLPLEEDICNA